MLFSKELEKIAYRHQLVRVFDDFMQMAICAFSYGKMEDRYAELCKGYNAEEIKLFGNTLGAMVMDYEKASDTTGIWGGHIGALF